MAELRVLGNNILLIPQTMEESRNGIIFSKKLQEQEVKNICTISVVGDDVKNKDLQEGITVLIPRHTGKWVEFEGFKYVLVKEDDILCIIDGIKVQKV